MRILKVLLSATSLLSGVANAALYDRGDGMIYDSTQNITWLQDANYAGTTGYSAAVPNTDPGITAKGAMTWGQATIWAADFVYGGYTDWRLPSAKLIADNGSRGGYDGVANESYNNTRSEIGHLYAELGNIAICQPSAMGCSAYGGGGFTHTGSFLNVQNYVYWEAEQFAGDSNDAWNFFVLENYQRSTYKGVTFYAWAVRDGDVAAVPVPASVLMFGSGLIALGSGLRGRKKGNI